MQGGGCSLDWLLTVAKGNTAEGRERRKEGGRMHDVPPVCTSQQQLMGVQ